MTEAGSASTDAPNKAGLHIAVWGPGTIGIMHATHAAQDEGVAAVTVLGRSAERAASGADDVRAALHANDRRVYATVSSSGEVESTLAAADGVVITTSTDTHIDFIRQAVAAGVPVLVEKPVSLDPEEILALAQELERTDVPVSVAFPRRFDPAHLELRRQVREGEIGSVRMIRALAHDHHPVGHDYVPKSGGILRDMGVHELDSVPWILGEEPLAITVVGSVIDDAEVGRLGDWDTASALLEFPSGVQGLLSWARNVGAGQNVRTEVHGTDRVIVAGRDSHEPYESTDPQGLASGPYYEDYRDRAEGAFRNEMAYFLQLCRGEVDNATPVIDSLSSSHLAVAALRSAQTGQRMVLS